jgi:hypothetical protein
MFVEQLSTPLLPPFPLICEPSGLVYLLFRRYLFASNDAPYFIPLTFLLATLL